MKVADLRCMLTKYNQNADVKMVFDGKTHEIQLSYGSSERCTPRSCDIVCICKDNEGIDNIT